MTRVNICPYEAGREEECLYGRGKIGKQIKKLLLLLALLVALFGTYGYAQDQNEVFVFSIDDEDGFIRSDENSCEVDRIRIGNGEGDSRVFINILSFDTSSITGDVSQAYLRLTLMDGNPIWEGDGQNGPGEEGWKNPDDDKPWIDLDDAFNGNAAFECPEDRDATPDIGAVHVDDRWGFDQLTGGGDTIVIELDANACTAIKNNNKVQLRIGVDDSSGSGDASDWSAMDFYDGGNGDANSPALWINPAFPPELLSVVADDPDHDDPALSDGDRLTLVFDMNTNAPPVNSKALIDDLINFGGKSLGANYTGAWNTDANTLVITVHNATGGNLNRGDTIAIKADDSNDLKNEAETSPPSTSSAEVSGYWGPATRSLFFGSTDVNGQGSALAYVKYDPSLAVGNRYSLHCYETTDTNISCIEVDGSRAGQGGGIYVAIHDGSEPNKPPGEGDKFLQEYNYTSDGGGDIALLRETWNDVTDIAFSPIFAPDSGLYGFERTVGHLVKFEPNDVNFHRAGETTEDDANGIGEVAIGVDGWIHCIFYETSSPRLENFIYEEDEDDPFSSQNQKGQQYVVDEMVMSPLDNTVIFDNKLEKGGTIEQEAYEYHFIDGYEVVSETPNSPDDLIPGIIDLAMLSDGTVVAIDVNSVGGAGDGNVALLGWEPHPHSIPPDFKDPNEGGQMSLIARQVISVGDVNTVYRLAVDEDDTIHVLGYDVVQAWRINPDEETFDAIDSFTIPGTGTGTEIAASVYREPPPPPPGIVYDVYDDFRIEQMPDDWTYMDPCETLLVNTEYVADFMCDTPSWSYEDPGGGTGPWDWGPYVLLPYINGAGCYGGASGEVLTFGPLLIRWTAPEAANDVEIIGYLWQVNNEDNNSVDHQLAYKLWLNDDDVNELGTWHVKSENGSTLTDRDNLMWFDDGDDDGVVRVPHIDVNDTISLLIDGSGPNAVDGNSYYGYVSFQIVLPKCYFGLVGDLDRDCTVGLADLEIMATNWLTDGEPDYFHDSIVNFNDHAKLAGRWLTGCKNEPDSAGCVPFIKSIDAEDGFNRDDDYSERDRIRVGDNGYGNRYNSLISFDTKILEGVEITRAWIGLTVMNRDIWGENPNPDPDKLGLTLDLSAAFNDDTSFEPADFNDAVFDVNDCAVEDDWGLTEAAVDEQVLIELNAAAIAAINTSGRTQFRINTPYSDDVNEPYSGAQADAIDIYDGGEDLDKAPVLIVE